MRYLSSLKQDHEPRHPEDCDRIQKVLLDEFSLIATLKEVEELWDIYSSEYWCAGWIMLPDSDHDLKQSIRTALDCSGYKI